jgi:peroxiredoxin
VAFSIGDPAPDVRVPSSWGDVFTLSEAVKEHNVVLSFYFFAFTGG